MRENDQKPNTPPPDPFTLDEALWPHLQPHPQSSADGMGMVAPDDDTLTPEAVDRLAADAIMRERQAPLDEEDNHFTAFDPKLELKEAINTIIEALSLGVSIDVVVHLPGYPWRRDEVIAIVDAAVREVRH
jgi:hypothetical protein